MNANEIINSWCEKAHNKNMFVHKKYFWNARDIIEKIINVPEKIKTETIQWINKNCRNTLERQIILEGMK